MITVRKVIETTAAKFSLTVDDLLQPKKAARFARPRQVAMHVARELTREGWEELGRQFCRDHTTVMHGHGQIVKLMAEDAYYKWVVENLLGELTACGSVYRRPPRPTKFRAPSTATSAEEKDMRRRWRADAQLTTVNGSRF